MQNSSRENEFFSTIPSMVEGAGGMTPERRQEKLDQLITNYRRPLTSSLTRKFRISEDEAEEVVHEFLMARLLEPSPEQNVAGQFLTASRTAPHLRFRNYLRRCLYNFYVDQRRRKQLPVVYVETLEGSAETHTENPRDDLHEDIIWANHLLNQACNAVQAQCSLRDQNNIWKIFQQRILRPIETNEPAVSYVELCSQGLAPSPKQAGNLLQTAIRKFNRALREIVAAYLPCDEETLPQAIEAELEEFRAALGTPDGLRLAESTDFSVSPGLSMSVDQHNLLSISEDVEKLWNESDLADYWSSLLRKPVEQLLTEMSMVTADSDTKEFEEGRQTLLQLLSNPRPPVQVLIAIKDAAKQSASQRVSAASGHSGPSDVFPPGVTMVIYGLSIAVARLRLNQRITSDPNHRFIPRVCRLLEFRWIDEQSRKVLREWLELLRKDL